MTRDTSSAPVTKFHACPVCRCNMWDPRVTPTKLDAMVENNLRLAREVNRLRRPGRGA